MKITKSQLRKIIKEEIVNELAPVYNAQAYHGDPYRSAQSQRAARRPDMSMNRERAVELRDEILAANGFDKKAQSAMFQSRDGKNILAHMFQLAKRHSRSQEANAAMQGFLDGKGVGQSKDFYEKLAQFRK